MRAELLHVVTTVSNPARWQSRWRLYRRFAEHMRASGVQLTTVEVVYGNRPPAITTSYGRVIHLRSTSELWHKENAGNIGIALLPDEAEYVGWIDADVEFTRPDWAAETVELLQERDVVQPWSEAVDLGPDHRLVGTPFRSFMSSWWNRVADPTGRYCDQSWHPGYAWAFRRRAWAALGGLIDWAVLGAADRHMAMALVGRLDNLLPKGISPAYRARIEAWRALAESHVHRNVGYLPGLLQHHWHGRKKDRAYVDRWQVLTRWRFDPDTDLRRDWRQHGLLEWSRQDCPRLRALRDDIRRYHRARNEDSIDLG